MVACRVAACEEEVRLMYRITTKDDSDLQLARPGG